METTFQRKVLIGCLMFMAIAVAYRGLLFAGLGLGVLSVLFANLPLYTCFGNEEEESNEEESN